MDSNSLEGKLPSVNAVLEQKELASLIKEIKRDIVISQVRKVIDEFRKSFRQGEEGEGLTTEEAARRTAQRIGDICSVRMKRVVNATGTVIHTGLGRAVLPEPVRKTINESLSGYCFLQTEQEGLERTVRERFIAELFTEIVGCETAVVANNNAGAVFLLLHSLAQGKEVIISRGELVEIGGSFRIPDVMKQSGAALVEVGTTNKTTAADYKNAITENTAAFMKVHQSNYRLEGFTAAPPVQELTDLAHEHGLCMIHDLGSGTMADLSSVCKSDEPLVKESFESDVDVVSFSGDKVLGGPQAGIILGKKKYLESMRKDPFFRILRPCKMTLVALEKTVSMYLLNDEALFSKIPVLEMFRKSIEDIEACAERLAAFVSSQKGFSAEIIDEFSASGGGALPGIRIPTRAVAVTSNPFTTDKLSYLLRTLPDIPVLGRISNDQLLLDPRTLLPGEEEEIKKAFAAAAAHPSQESK
ncbi:L-seryl-tRNA(Sec) selenium transferase [Planctomycetota bacterium]